jgi:hypothetical protein
MIEAVEFRCEERGRFMEVIVVRGGIVEILPGVVFPLPSERLLGLLDLPEF